MYYNVPQMEPAARRASREDKRKVGVDLHIHRGKRRAIREVMKGCA